MPLFKPHNWKFPFAMNKSFVFARNLGLFNLFFWAKADGYELRNGGVREKKGRWNFITFLFLKSLLDERLSIIVLWANKWLILCERCNQNFVITYLDGFTLPQSSKVYCSWWYFSLLTSVILFFFIQYSSSHSLISFHLFHHSRHSSLFPCEIT